MPHISEYGISRHYGGPEEGGWWYDRHHFVRVVAWANDEEDAFAIARGLNDRAAEERKANNDPGRSSVCAGTNEDVAYMAEPHPGKFDDTREPRPHYE